jgi:hypothetical protein
MQGVVTARSCDCRPTLKGRDADGQDTNRASRPPMKSASRFWRLVQAVFRSVRATLLTAFGLSPSQDPFYWQLLRRRPEPQGN